jgi:hypothetical protein
MKSHKKKSLKILELDSWCFSFIKINILSTVNKVQATVSFFLRERGRGRENIHSVFFQKKDQNVSGERSVISKKYIKIIRTYSHTIVSFETRQIYSRVITLGCRLLREYGCLNGSINKPA